MFILGPDSVIGPEVEKKLKPLARRVRRVQGPTPVQNAIEFARFQSGSFGWGAEVPGQNFTVASTSRPLDAAGEDEASLLLLADLAQDLRWEAASAAGLAAPADAVESAVQQLSTAERVELARLLRKELAWNQRGRAQG